MMVTHISHIEVQNDNCHLLYSIQRSDNYLQTLKSAIDDDVLADTGRRSKSRSPPPVEQREFAARISVLTAIPKPSAKNRGLVKSFNTEGVTEVYVRTYCAHHDDVCIDWVALAPQM